MTTRETCFKAKENLSAISLASEQDMNKMLSASANALRVQAQYIIAENKKILQIVRAANSLWIGSC